MSDEIRFESVGCPLCGEAESRHVLSATDVLCGVEGVFGLVRCVACRHVWLNPRPALESIGICYPENYGPHQRRSAMPEPVPAVGPDMAGDSERAATTPWYLSPTARRIPGLRSLYYWLTDFRTEFIPEGPALPGHALDIGCSSGDFLVTLRDSNWTAEGVELMEGPAAQARQRGFVVHTGTLEDARLEGKRFDAVFASMVLEHLHDPLSTLREVHRLLRADGWFVFTVPNFACWERFFFRGCWRGLELPRHLQHYTPRRLRRLLADEGFVQVQVLHQRNLNNVIASVGLWLRRRAWGRGLGQRMLDFTDRPTMWWQLLLALPARFFALIRQSGRLTVTARRAPP